MQRAEPGGQIALLFLGHRLVAEEDHLPVHQRGMDRGERFAVERLRQVHPLNDRANGGGQRFNRDGHGAPGQEGQTGATYAEIAALRIDPAQD